MPATKTILVVAQNLIFLPRVENSAAPLGIRVRLAATSEKFAELYGQVEVPLVLVDLEGSRDTWTSVVGTLIGSDSRPRIVAYGPHSDVETLELARNAGCDEVLTKGQFSSSLHELVGAAADAPAHS